jgi:[acyl-carrier-protein] S-malonyltransferase
MTKAFIFPGQGSQTVGMGKALAEAFSEARDVFKEVDDALGQHLSKLMFEGPESDLTLTANAQPAIMASSLAVWRVLEKQVGVKMTDAAYVAGHSLGEYSALCAAGMFTLADTAKLLRIRGEAMQAATPAGTGGMAAILGVDTDVLQAICEQAAKETNGVCVLANYNAPGQIVISGSSDAVAKACELAKAAGAKRALLLNVSAPFHSPLMQPAADKMREALAAVKAQNPLIPVIANVTAQPVQDTAIIKDLLVSQVTGSVRWSESVETMGKLGVTHAVEIGTGKVLSGLVKRIVDGISTASVESPADIDVAAKAA